MENKINYLDLFVNSDRFDWISEDNIKFAYENISKVETELIELGKKMGIVEADITALLTEIGADINEEVAEKARAIMGRWVNASSYDDTRLFIPAICKIGVFYPDQSKKIMSQILDKEVTETPVVPFAICLGWCLIIEANIAAEKGARQNTTYMPETLPLVIFIDRMSRWKGHADIERKLFFQTLMDMFVNNWVRYDQNKQPHPSEIAYLTVVKNSFEHIGGDPSAWAYRSLDNEKQDWNLFQFLITDTK